MTLKRPAGVGVVAAPIAAEKEASGRDPCISQIRRSCRLARIQVLVWTVRRPCRLIQPVRPFGFSGSTTRPQRRSVVVRSTHSQVGAPSGVAAGRWATVAPPGDERTVAPCGADTSRKRGLSAARACAGRATASTASPTATIALHRRIRSRSASNLSTHGPPSPRLPVASEALILPRCLSCYKNMVRLQDGAGTGGVTPITLSAGPATCPVTRCCYLIETASRSG